MTTRNSKSGTPLSPNKKSNNTPAPTQETVIYTTYPPLKTIPKERHVPVIYLQGSWLKRLGFEVGCRFLVEPHPNKLVITVLKGGNQHG